MAATVALLQHFTHGTVYYIETSYCVHGTVHSFIAHTKSKHFNTRSNHYYGKSLYTLPNQTLPYRLLYNPAFLHMTVLCCLQSPPLLRQIYTRRPCWGGERKEKGKVYYLFVTKSVHHFGELFYTVLQHFIPTYCTVHLIPLYFLTIGWIFHVAQYIYTRYEILLCSLQYTVHSLYSIT